MKKNNKTLKLPCIFHTLDYHQFREVQDCLLQFGIKVKYKELHTIPDEYDTFGYYAVFYIRSLDKKIIKKLIKNKNLNAYL